MKEFYVRLKRADDGTICGEVLNSEEGFELDVIYGDTIKEVKRKIKKALLNLYKFEDELEFHFMFDD